MPSLLQRVTAWLGMGAAAPVPRTGSGGWWPIVREPYTGAWQQNAEIRWDTALSNPTVFRCVSLISSDIKKTRLRLVAIDTNGIWIETTSAAFSPVLRRPNRYQTMPQFLESWMISKLIHGNTYVLKERDERNVVKALYVLDPMQVIPLVAPDQSVYYELTRNDLAGVPADPPVVVPASEIIHDRWNTWFHPLVGVSPLYACSGAAQQGLAMQSYMTAFFSNGTRPTGILLTPVEIDELSAKRLSDKIHSLPAGHMAVAHNLQYLNIPAATAADTQLTEQQGWSAKTVASCFGMPISKVDSSIQPPYANSEATQLQYLEDCLQVHMFDIETCLDSGLELPAPYGTEFDYDDLLWMDMTTRTTAAKTSISAGALSPNEARYKFFGLWPVPGGETPYLQQQYFSLAALAERDAAEPFAKPAAPPSPTEPSEEDVAATMGALAES
jgi:HK97 family phage portal protein